MTEKNIRWACRYVFTRCFEQEQPLFVQSKERASWGIQGKKVRHDYRKTDWVEVVSRFKLLSETQLDLLKLRKKAHKSGINPCYVEFCENGIQRNYYLVTDIEKTLSLDYEKYVEDYYRTRRKHQFYFK